MVGTRVWHLTLLVFALGGCATASTPRRESGIGGSPPKAASRESERPRDASIPAKPRVVVTADPELDDSNSLIRYLLHSPDFRTEGLIYASSGFHWKGDGTGKKWSVPNREYFRFGLNLCPCTSWRWMPNERFINDAVETYAKVYRNLRVHDPRYAPPAALQSKIRWGNVEFDGDISKDSPGSDLIKSLLLDDEPGPIYLLAWGGQSTIARALKSIEEQYKGTPQWQAIHEKVSRKAILSPSGDQDDTYANYIHPNWPNVKSLPIGMGGVALVYGAVATASAENAVYYSADWTKQHISARGPLGAFYRVWGDGKQMVKGDIFDYFGLSGYAVPQLRSMGYIVWTPPRPKGAFIGEGDTFTYLNLIDNGLLGYEDGTQGGWAGHVVRLVALRDSAQRGGQSTSTFTYEDFLKSVERAAAAGDVPPAARPPSPTPNFTPAAQNALAARMMWSVTPTYAGANHEPHVTLRGSSRIDARPGATFRLEAVMSDPDGNAVTVKWWRWKDVDTYPSDVRLSNTASTAIDVQVPADATAGQTIQLVVEATDNGTPSLTRYQRVVVTITR